jgi:hypothetical protein
MDTSRDPRDEQWVDQPSDEAEWTSAEYDEENAEYAEEYPEEYEEEYDDASPYYDGQQVEETEGEPGQYYDAEQTAAPVGPPISVGSILSHTFSVFFKNPGLFLALGFLVVLPAVLLDVESIRNPGYRFLAQLGVNVIQLVFQGAMAYGVFQVLRGEKAGIGDAMGRGMSRIVPLCGAALLLGIAKVIGYLLLIVPGIIMTCVWIVTIPACVVEKLGASRSMERSAELTRGNRWSIFGLVALLFVVMVLLGLGVGFGLVALTGGNKAVAQMAVAFVAFIPQTFDSVMCAVLYYDLRASREGVTVDSLANVFD